MKFRVIRSLIGLLVVTGVLFGALLLVPSSSAWSIGNPSSLQIDDIAVFPDLWVTGDQLYFMEYEVNYSPVPSESPLSTWAMALYDTTGTSLLPSGLVPLNYYQHNIISKYYTPGTAPTWGSAYYIRLMGQAAYFSPWIEGTNMRTWVLGASNYKLKSDALSYFVAEATRLQTALGITILDSSNRLNTTGSTLFTTAVPGLASSYIGSSFFETFSSIPTALGANYTGAAREAARKTAEGSLLSGATASIGSWIGLSGNWVEAIGIWFAIILFASIVYPATRNPQVGIFYAVAIAITFGSMGLGLDVFLAIALGIFMIAVLFAIVWILPRF